MNEFLLRAAGTGTLLVLLLSACGAPSGTPAPRPTWPVSPEPLPAATTSFTSEFGPASWALDPAFPAPGPKTRELHILVWERACSGGSPTTGRMSVPVIAYSPTNIIITIKVRPLPGAQECPGPPGTPALLVLSEALGDRQLYDGGAEPPALPRPPF